ncbi:MAG: aldolase/citrate lyase family protein [bacterium]|nr:aldolase/citrate lyase family protein [bacterium]
MRNRIREKLDRNTPAFGAQLRFASPAIAELFGHSGFDYIVIDTEHAPQTPPGIQAQLQAIGNTPAAPVVRLSGINEEQIRLYLDMGAMGIIAPFVNTAEEAAAGARACRYPPTGIRGFGPHRASRYGLNTEEYFSTINDQVMFIGLIETAEAVDNIDGILAVEGFDSFIIGPVDLSISLGVPFDYEGQVFQAAQAKLAAAAQRAGKPAGIAVYRPPAAAQSLQRAIDDGFSLILAGGDEPLLAAGCQQLAQIRAGLGF